MKLTDMLQQLFSYLIAHGVDTLLPAMIIGVVGYRLARILPRLLGRVMTRARVDPTLTMFITYVSRYTLFIFVTIFILGRLGVETTSLVAVLGAAGLAIGLALQGSLSNFAAGVLIIVLRPFQVGDLVEAGGTTGTVQEIQIFTTVLHTVDNLRVMVPNDLIMKGKITNYSANETRRVDITVGVASTNDLEQVQQMLTGILAETPGVLATPAPLVAVSEFGNTNVQLMLQAWTKTGEYQTVRSALLTQIKLALDEHGIAL
ncbi:MAG TPA: mechanosensitive ion channel domain-containing protein [Candidatus Binatia bacterium]|nr:mechanosensitive ion channel domain-containing protein [Candidatus Binatia bacterium]